MNIKHIGFQRGCSGQYEMLNHQFTEYSNQITFIFTMWKRKTIHSTNHTVRSVCVCVALIKLARLFHGSWDIIHIISIMYRRIGFNIQLKVQFSRVHQIVSTSYNKNRIQKPTNESVISHWNESMLNWQFAFRMFDNRIKQKKTVSLKMIRMVQLVWRRHEHTTTKAFQFDFAHLESAQLHV